MGWWAGVAQARHAAIAQACAFNLERLLIEQPWAAQQAKLSCGSVHAGPLPPERIENKGPGRGEGYPAFSANSARNHKIKYLRDRGLSPVHGESG